MFIRKFYHKIELQEEKRIPGRKSSKYIKKLKELGNNKKDK